MLELRTDRLLLRGWRAADRAPFAELNADPEVMRHFPETLTREQSDVLADWLEARAEPEGWGPWALEERATGRFLGFAGLLRVSFEARFTPAVEIGWRLARPAWRRGFATEAARAALAHAFDALRLEEVVAMTVPGNARSRAVMERLGMRRDPAGDFEHPGIAEGHPLRPHVLYRVDRARHVATLDV